LPLDGSPADGGAFLAGLAGSTGQEAVRQPAAGAEAEVEFSPSGSLPAPSADRLMSGTAAARGVRRARPVTRGAGRDPVLWLIAGVVFGAYATISIFRYLRRDPTSWDLGIFTEYVKQFAHLHAPIVDIRGPGFNLLGDHFHPIVAVLAPFFRLAPTPVTLLIAQALLTALSVIPVYRAADQLLSRGAAQAITAAYGLSWGLQQLANYDFHEIAFAVPLLAASLSALIRGRTRAALWWALPLVLVKEDQGLTLAALGLIIAFSYRRRAPGLILAGWGLAWSLLAILVIIPHFSADHTYSYWSQAGAISPVGGNFSVGGLWSHLTDGIGTKLPTLALILLPTAFLALRSPLVLAILPSLALRFIAVKSAYWGTDWHYNATVMPIVFIAAIDGMARIKAARARAEDGSQEHGRDNGGQDNGGQEAVRARLAAFARRAAGNLEHYGAAAMLALAAGLAFQFPLSSLWTPATYSLGPHVAAENAAMALVPNGAKVSTDLDLLAPLAARTDTYWLGNFNNPVTTYVVFDTESTDWQPPPANVQQFVEQLEHGAQFRQIFEQDGVYVFRRAG
jgi:uncharacterized membrane protein